GGSNYVVHVEEAREDSDYVFGSVSEFDGISLKPASTLPLPQGVHFFMTELRGEKHRMAVVAPTDVDARTIISGLQPLKGAQLLSEKDIRSLAKQGVYLWPVNRKKNALAFIFPGQGSHYAGMGLELYQTFPEVKEWMDRVAAVADFDILKLMFYDTEEDLQKTRWQQPALFTLELAIVKYLMAMGVEPSALAGHSLGELTALCLSGVYSYEDGFRIVNKRAICMDKACDVNIDPGVMMAVDAPLDYLKEILSKREHIYITNINSPRQVVLGGNTEAVKELGEELKAQGYRRTLLRVSMAFHSPIMRCIHDELDAFVSQIQFHPPGIPVVSNTTMKPFPSDSTEIRAIIMAHLESCVHWMQNATTLWDDFGVRTFVEVGPRDILTNLVSDTLPEADCIYTSQPSSEVSIFRGAVAQLYVRGHIPVQGDFVPFPGEITRLSHAMAVRPSSLPAGAMAVALPPSVSQPIHDHIQTFVADGFGKFFKPALLYSIRRDFDPHFDENDLEQTLMALYPGLGGVQPLVRLPIAPSTQKQPTMMGQPAQGLTEIRPPASEGDELTETVIRLIMDATGYERPEIEPEMDLREDLSIRSSRLPVIMDSMENQFGIKIHLEDFMEVRTIADIVEKLRELLGESSGLPGSPRQQKAEPELEGVAASADVSEERTEPIRRIVFQESELKLSEARPISLSAEDTVLVLTTSRQNALSVKVVDVLQQKYGVGTKVVEYLSSPASGSESEKAGVVFNNRLQETAADTDRLAGVMIVLSKDLAKAIPDPAEASRILTEFFSVAKVFIDSPDKKFAFCIYEHDDSSDIVSLVAQGTLGMFLSLGHEFSSIQFRVIGISSSTDLGAAIDHGLDRGQKVIETFYKHQRLYTTVGIPERLRVTDEGTFSLRPEDVILLSGGARGITYHLARKLADFGCKLVFLGTTPIDPSVDYKKLLNEGIVTPELLSEEIRRRKPGLSEESLRTEQAALAKALDIISNVEALRASGVEASYYRCDVTDRDQTNQAITEILRRYNGIHGVVHGAGILKDNFAKQMSVEDFRLVTDVKFLGALNLWRATEDSGLRFFVCLSSAAAIQGNPGQANYSTGNRMMSALAGLVRSNNKQTLFKALQLPPIEGSGMAENEEIRALMKRMNAAYVHVDELGELFARELMFGSIDEAWVLFMRSLPQLETSLLELTEPQVPASRLIVGPTELEVA
ncbi:MAG: hypothetical protein QG577_735, partial [Thermodesulfobacteriota bacterium]|nr:hypothetical protein [Thermodesulfobacteriota bacterium]